MRRAMDVSAKHTVQARPQTQAHHYRTPHFPHHQRRPQTEQHGRQHVQQQHQEGWAHTQLPGKQHTQQLKQEDQTYQRHTHSSKSHTQQHEVGWAHTQQDEKRWAYTQQEGRQGYTQEGRGEHTCSRPHTQQQWQRQTQQMARSFSPNRSVGHTQEQGWQGHEEHTFQKSHSHSRGRPQSEHARSTS
jgi:hypothetical protein